MSIAAPRYDNVAIALHWVIAALIVAAFVFGLTIDDFPASWKNAVINLHALIGLSVLVLSLARLAWRLGHRPPAYDPPLGLAARRLSAAGHGLLYVLMIAVPVIGLPTLFFRGLGLDFGLLQVASPVARNRDVYRPLTEIHELASYLMIALAAGHALAAFYHQFVTRDQVLRRMMPGTPG